MKAQLCPSLRAGFSLEHPAGPATSQAGRVPVPPYHPGTHMTAALNI